MKWYTFMQMDLLFFNSLVSDSFSSSSFLFVLLRLSMLMSTKYTTFSSVNITATSYSSMKRHLNTTYGLSYSFIFSNLNFITLYVLGWLILVRRQNCYWSMGFWGEKDLVEGLSSLEEDVLRRGDWEFRDVRVLEDKQLSRSDFLFVK